MTDQVEYTLTSPIVVRFKGATGDREESIDTVSIRQPKGRDMRVLDKHPGEIGQALAMIARLTGLTDAQVDEMSPRDIGEISAVIEGFMAPGLPTGGS